MELSDINWFKYAAPQRFYPLAGKLLPWCAAVAVLLCVAGLALGMFIAPTDAQQGDAYAVHQRHDVACDVLLRSRVPIAAAASAAADE